MASLAQIDEWHYVGDPGEPAFENGWATQPGLTALAFRLRSGELIDLAGVAGGGNGETIFTLPVGCRPTQVAMPGVLAQDGTPFQGAILFIETDGKVTPYVPGLSTGDPISLVASTITYLNPPAVA